MGEHYKKFPFEPADMAIVNMNRWARIKLERDNLRIFKKMIMDAKTPITAEEIKNILEAAGF